jgi:hypothetical protein
MSSFNSEGQASNVRPPRRGAVITLTVDSTARAYDLSVLTLGGGKPSADGSGARNVYLTLQSNADLFYHFSDTNSAVLDDTATLSVGSTLAFANTYGAKLVSGQDVPVRLDRGVDKYIVLKTNSGTATLRFWASSDSE